MKCKNCGNELMDGAVFCQACGTKQDEPSVEVKQEETKAPETAEAPKAEETTVEEKKEESAAQPEVQAQPQPEAQVQPQAPFQPQAPVQPQAGEVKKKKPVLPIIIGIVACLAVIGLVVLGIKLIGGLGSKNSSSTVAYISKGTLCIIKDATAKEPKIIEVCDLDIDDSAYLPYNFVSWSDDQKTLYFFDDVNEDGIGDLCCVQVSKLGKDKAKNESKVVVIDDNIDIDSFTILDNGKLLYRTSKDKICIYGGKEPEELAKDVASFNKTNDEKGIVYLADEDEDGSTLYYMPVSGGDVVELDDEVDYIYSVKDNCVYYEKSDYDDETYNYSWSLYVSDFDGKVDEITDLLGSVGSITDNGFYYTEENDETVTLYDYIDDPYASSDEKAVAPEYPNTSAGFVSADAEEVFDDYKLGRIAKKFGGDPVAYMEDNCWSYTYGDKEYYYIYNSDTYEDYYYDIEAGVYYRYDSDKMSEAYDKYYADQEEWYDIQNRIYTRDALKEYEVNPGYVTLFYYHDGESEEIVSECKDVKFVYIGMETPMAFYHEADSDGTQKISIDDIDYAYEAYDMLFGYNAGSDYSDIYYAIGKDADLSLGESGSVKNIGGSFTDSRIALEIAKEDEDENDILLYTLKNTSLEQDSKFDDDAEVVSAFTDGKVYFIKNVSDYGETGDLFIYDGKENTKVIKNINLYNSGYVYDSGSIICFDNNGKAILYNAAGEEIIKLGSVDSLWRDVNYINDKKVLYVADDKLCYYNGKETAKIATRVDYVRFNNTSGTTLSVHYYYY